MESRIYAKQPASLEELQRIVFEYVQMTLEILLNVPSQLEQKLYHYMTVNG